jgi:Nucleotide modification associated domain 3
VKGLLVRVGADQSDDGGGWNGPVDRGTWRFLYVPIRERDPSHPGLNTPFRLAEPWLASFGLSLPPHLCAGDMHLDPDFEYLTYGDSDFRASQILAKVNRDDLLVFYAGLRDTSRAKTQLVYAIIGLYVIDEIMPVMSVPKRLWHQNAHTRRLPGTRTVQIVVRARPTLSGRLVRCIPIGNYRHRAYRVFPDLLMKWGGLSVKNGYIQRSARLPEFQNAAQFYSWFRAQSVPLIRRNN